MGASQNMQKKELRLKAQKCLMEQVSEANVRTKKRDTCAGGNRATQDGRKIEKKGWGYARGAMKKPASEVFAEKEKRENITCLRSS